LFGGVEAGLAGAGEKLRTRLDEIGRLKNFYSEAPSKEPRFLGEVEPAWIKKLEANEAFEEMAARPDYFLSPEDEEAELPAEEPRAAVQAPAWRRLETETASVYVPPPAGSARREIFSGGPLPELTPEEIIPPPEISAPVEPELEPQKISGQEPQAAPVPLQPEPEAAAAAPVIIQPEPEAASAAPVSPPAEEPAAGQTGTETLKADSELARMARSAFWTTASIPPSQKPAPPPRPGAIAEIKLVSQSDKLASDLLKPSPEGQAEPEAKPDKEVSTSQIFAGGVSSVQTDQPKAVPPPELPPPPQPEAAPQSPPVPAAPEPLPVPAATAPASDTKNVVASLALAKPTMPQAGRRKKKAASRAVVLALLAALVAAAAGGIWFFLKDEDSGLGRLTMMDMAVSKGSDSSEKTSLVSGRGSAVETGAVVQPAAAPAPSGGTLSQSVMQAVETAKRQDLGFGRGTLEQWLRNSFSPGAGAQENWSAALLHGDAYVVQYRLLRPGAEPIVYQFEVNLSAGAITRGINSAALELLAGGAAPQTKKPAAKPAKTPVKRPAKTGVMPQLPLPSAPYQKKSGGAQALNVQGNGLSTD